MIRWRTTCVAFMFVLGACSSGPSSPASSTSAPSTAARLHQALLVSTRCADLIVLGARGSNQSVDKNHGVGREVLVSVERMAARLHTRSRATVRLEAVPYVATSGPAYDANVTDGTHRMADQIRSLARNCPESHFAVVGFSQGAQVVHDFAVNLSQDMSRRVVLIAMIADPRRNPTDSISNWSYASAVTSGIGKLGAGPAFGAALRGKAISFCVKGDEICNLPPGGYDGPLSDTHRHFYEKSDTARSTGQHLDEVLRRNRV